MEFNQFRDRVYEMVEQAVLAAWKSFDQQKIDDGAQGALMHFGEDDLAAGILIRALRNFKQDVVGGQKINLNTEVKVKLTQLGHTIWVQYQDELKIPPSLRRFHPPEKFTLWEIGAIFGRHMYNGADLVMETELEVV
jgi:hypothetical protein